MKTYKYIIVELPHEKRARHYKKAYNEGVEAFKQGKSVDDFHYKTPFLIEAWSDGWITMDLADYVPPVIDRCDTEFIELMNSAFIRGMFPNC